MQIQPMDVSVFHSLKDAWKETVTQWRITNSGEQLKKENFRPILQQVLDGVIYPEMLKNGFEKCGLVPWNIKAVDFTKIVGSAEPEIKTDPFAMRNLKIAIGLIESEIGETIQ